MGNFVMNAILVDSGRAIRLRRSTVTLLTSEAAKFDVQLSDLGCLSL